MADLIQTLATELAARPQQVDAAVKLLDEGATVPFIARYRKEVTGGLDDTQLRTLEERLRYLRELEERRAAILASITEQGKLTPESERSILSATSKTELEDLYLPYRPKRRTKAMIAREAGLEPLALLLWREPKHDPEVEAPRFVDAEKGVADVKAALEGARQILMELWSEDAQLVGASRAWLWQNGVLSSRKNAKAGEEAIKFSDYFEYAEPIRRIPSHRALALFRGREASVLLLSLDEPSLEPSSPGTAAVSTGAIKPLSVGAERVARHVGVADRGREADAWLLETARAAWKQKLSLHLEVALMVELRNAAEEEAIRVFGKNLRDLLLAAPAGAKVTMGLDPGLRTGVKVAVVDSTGKLLETGTIYPHAPRNDWDRSIATLRAMAARHGVNLISIGNGTASRETDRLAAELMKRHPELTLERVVVSEAGASVYSASALAAAEFPDLDVSLRGAVSIARRIQDPLAELVKIEPKSIGVGQYQHDVDQPSLARALDAVVEDCVNAVGVELNLASAPLLARVSGLNATLAKNIVEHRDTHGPFADRGAIRKVARLGPKAFEQAAGFLRIRGGSNPLDASAVHPEAYPVVERILARNACRLGEVMGSAEFTRRLRAEDYVDDRFGLPTVRDILAELEKPGRDPRPTFSTASFREGVESLEDLKVGMQLEGVVTNVANFGAFVDIGVHQDGLVHVSRLAKRFVRDPRDVVKVGQVVQVKVLEIDLARKRVGLTLRLDDPIDGA
ncbi:MAG: Tex family protein [Candidatus Eisenbacteria bacterium]